MTSPRLRRRLIDDVRLGATAAAAGLAAAAVVEAIVTWHQFRGGVGVIMAARLVALSATLCALAWLVIGPLVGAAAALPRLWTALRDGRAAARARPEPGLAPSRWPPDAVATVLVGGLALVGFVAATTHLGARFIRSYKEPTLTALVTAIAAVVLGALALALVRIGALLYVFPYFPGIRSANELPRVYLTQAMVDDGTFAIDRGVARWGTTADVAAGGGAARRRSPARARRPRPPPARPARPSPAGSSGRRAASAGPRPRWCWCR